MDSNVRDGVLFRDPTSTQEREAVASSCVRNLGIQFPALLDPVSNQVEEAYSGWPDRLYLIDARGRVAFKSEAGPFGFHPAILERELAKAVGAQPK